MEIFTCNREKFDSPAFYPEKVNQLTKELKLIVARGTSRDGEIQANDVVIRVDTIQEARWVVEL